MAQKSVKVDFSRVEGIPLFKKFAMFDSGLVPLSRYERDAHLFQRCKNPFPANRSVYPVTAAWN